MLFLFGGRGLVNNIEYFSIFRARFGAVLLASLARCEMRERQVHTSDERYMADWLHIMPFCLFVGY